MHRRLQEAGGLRPGVAARVARETGLPEAEVYGSGSFYHLLADPDVDLRVCQGLSCWLAGSGELLARARATGLSAEPCGCLAACDRAPVGLRERELVPDLSDDRLGRTPVDGGRDDADAWLGAVGPAGVAAGPARDPSRRCARSLRRRAGARAGARQRGCAARARGVGTPGARRSRLPRPREVAVGVRADGAAPPPGAQRRRGRAGDLQGTARSCCGGPTACWRGWRWRRLQSARKR